MPGSYEVRPLPFAYDALDGISEQVTRWHHDKIYAGYVEQLNEIVRKLQTVDRSDVNPLQSHYNDLKRAELRATNGMHLHQLFWECLGGDGSPAGTRVGERIRDEFGSHESWTEDFIACGKAAGSGWAILAYDSYADRLRNCVAENDTAAMWGCHPMVVLDLAEHAYYYDHGPKRTAYIKTFLANVSWKAVDKRYAKLVVE